MQTCWYPLLICLLTVLIAKGLGWYWFVGAGVNVLQLAVEPGHLRWNLPHTVWIAYLPVAINREQIATTLTSTKVIKIIVFAPVYSHSYYARMEVHVACMIVLHNV